VNVGSVDSNWAPLGGPSLHRWSALAGGIDVGVWLAVGAGVGTAVGLATHHLAIGLAPGCRGGRDC